MQSSTIKFWVCTGSLLFYLLAPKPTTAEIVPDTTLPNNSIVLPNGNTFEIKDGTIVGNNLFHSFQKFSIPDGGSANFNNALTIQNIITRVTGKDISNINGKISAIGTANLFLLNPNGIIFGPKASLNIGGSFIATTASSLKFADGTEFRTDGTQTTPLLTMTVPMGLQFGANPGPIENKSQFDGVGLQVKPEKTLALVGGNVELEGGYLTTPGGRIELGSVAGNNLVSLKQTNEGGWELGYQDIQNFQDITLSQGAYAGSSDFKGADIQIQGRYVTITGSLVGSGANIDGQSGAIKVNASDTLELVSKPTDQSQTALFNEVDGNVKGRAIEIETGRLIVRGGALVTTNTYGQDTGGNLTINTKQLIVQDGSQVLTTTSGTGNAGNLTVNGSESVLLKGAAINGEFSSGLYAQVQGDGATGNAGDLTITTKTLQVLEGAQISAATLSAGNGGNLTINASDILLSGSTTQAKPTPEDQNRSGVFVAAFKNNLNDPRVLGDVGQLNIRAEQLTVENGARVSANNFSLGREGSATLNVGKLVIQNGGEVTAQSLAQGSGGTLNVNASESIQVTGTGTIDSTSVPSTLSAEAISSGKAGNLNIQTPRLDVRNGGEVTVRSQQGSGQAGNLIITANDIRFNNGKLTATTNAGEEGNIRLQNVDQLLMENNSLISAKGSNNGNGGNINIDAANGIIIGVPGRNNDIVANAEGGNGGDITIKTSGIYGFRVGTLTPNTNDIDASSQFGLPGTVNINRADVDPSQAFVELPADAVDPSGLIASGCATNDLANSGQFIITGRGGLPPSPDQPLSTDVVWSDTRIPKITAQQQPSEVAAVKPPSKQADAVKIVPATGWVFNGKGQVTLISSASTNNPHPSLQNSVSCASR